METNSNIPSAKQRIEQILEYEGQFTEECYQDADGRMIVAELSREMGLSNDQVLRDLLREKTKSISAKFAKKIHNAKPKYRMDWLLYGTGEMLDPDAPKDRRPEPSKPTDANATIASLVEMLRAKDDDIRKLMLSLDEERHRVAELERYIESLADSPAKAKKA